MLPVLNRTATVTKGLISWHDETMPNTQAGEAFALAIEYYREVDGRWLADIAALPGVTAYGRTKKQATAAVQALALRLIADRLEHGEALPGPMRVSFIAASELIPKLAVRQSDESSRRADWLEDQTPRRHFPSDSRSAGVDLRFMTSQTAGHAFLTVQR
jgi:predicted RNase H-like HicB family nuclease